MRPNRARYEALFETEGEPESNSGWMVSYMDIMTLLVAFFVLLFALTLSLDESEAEGSSVTLYSAVAAELPTAAESPSAGMLGVPLPEEMLMVAAGNASSNGATLAASTPRLEPSAIVVSLGVAGRVQAVPATPVAEQSFPSVSLDAAPLVVAANGANLDMPLEEMVVVVTDTAPARSQEIDPEVVAVATTLAETLERRLPEAPYLPSLDGVEVSRVAEGINLRVEDNLLFSSAEADLTGGGQELIESLVELIQRHDGEVSVEGHTDSRPISTPQFPSNWELSSARATAILRHLVDAGVAPSRLRAVGFGDTRPLAENDSVEGQAKNRRVEVIIHL